MQTKILLAIAVISVMSILPNDADADRGLVGWWKFDEGSGRVAHDASGHGNNGTIVGARWQNNGGTALSFDGRKNWVVIFDSDSISVGNKDYTIAAWIYPKSLAAEQGIVAKVMNRSNKEYALGTYQTRLRLDVEQNSNGGRAETVENVITADSWQHVAVTFDSTTLTATFYRNGVVQTLSSQSIKALPDELDDHLYIGRWAGVYGVHVDQPHHFTGLIKDVRVYSSVLTGAEVAAIYTSEIVNRAMEEPTTEASQVAYENLQSLGNWAADTTVRTMHADQIAGALLVITRLKQAKGYPRNEVQQEYYRIAEEFPGSAHAIAALCQLAILDGKNGLQHARKLLEEDPTKVRLVGFYASVVKQYLSEPDYVELRKYVKDFVDRYASADDNPSLIVQLIKSIGLVDNSSKLAKIIIEQSALHERSLESCCAVLRWQVSQPSQAKNSQQFLELVSWCRTRFAQTKLAACATAALADKEYEEGRYVAALLVFKPQLFKKGRSEPEIIEDADGAVRFYSANTLQRRQINVGQLYEALAEHAHTQKQNSVAVHCYEQSARARGINLAVFKSAASRTTKYAGSDPNVQIWFWKGLFAAESGDLTVASLAYDRFLARDSTSVLAARAFYDLARAQIAIGRDARDAISKAKTISPCEPVIRLEQSCNRSTFVATEKN
jgi:hypothetical protein